jgi:hypothetical protein
MDSDSLTSPALHGTIRYRLFWVVLILLCTIGAAAAARRLFALDAVSSGGLSPFASLDLHFAGRAELTRLHVVPSLLFVLLVPLQFVSRLRQSRPRLHRWTGRVLLGCTLLIGLSALRLSASPVGGLAESTATVLFGCLFLFSAAKAWWHIRHRHVVLHREWATRMVAIALGVATTRPIIGLFFATSRLTGLTPHDFFGPAMWIGFLSTWLAGEAWISYTRPHRRSVSTSAVRTAG